MVVSSSTQATHALCELDPTARGAKNKWPVKKFIRAPKKATVNDLTAFLLESPLVTERDIKRSRVKLVSIKTIMGAPYNLPK